MASSASREDVSRNTTTKAREIVGHYPAQQQLIRRFITTFESDECKDSRFGKLKYKAALRQAANRHIETVWIDLDDLEQWCQRQQTEPDETIVAALGLTKTKVQQSAEELVSSVEKSAMQFSQFFREACSLEMPERDEDANTDKTGIAKDTIAEWRRRVEEQKRRDTSLGGSNHAQVPQRLRNSFDIRFKPRARIVTSKLREVKADEVGSLVQMRAIVVKISPVKPKIEIATYNCEVCEAEIFQEVEGDLYTPVMECQSQKCKENQQKGKVCLRIRTSKFVRFQELKVQEMSDDVPVGGVPRSMSVVCSSDLTRQVLPGDSVQLTGVYRPYELPHYVARRRGPEQEMFLEAHHIAKLKKGYGEEINNDEEEMDARIDQELRQGDLYEKAAKSIAPEIYGHVDVKKALLLLLVGGTTKHMTDGMKIRGDIHTLLMGDPGVAKSQLLKQVCNIAPRSVYTTGKGSSGVGLTASVTREKTTGEVTLEGGALVLADMGVCCIDEFDKMDENDRTSIHEVMEQQTVSIAKAGITTTLNTRTTVLAAANPAFGRYNPYKSPVENMAMPAALLSRFDLQFLLLDTVDREKDHNLALHVTKVHSAPRELDQEAVQKGGMKLISDLDTVLEGEFKPFNHKLMRMYIRKARQVEPLISEHLKGDIADHYVAMRQEEKNSNHDSRKAYTTPRQLLALLRLSMAVARTRFSDRVERQDLEEAMRLVRASKESVELARPSKEGVNPLDVVYDIVKELSQREASRNNDGYVEVAMVVNMAGHKALTQEMVEEALANWESLSVMNRNETKALVRFLVPVDA